MTYFKRQLHFNLDVFVFVDLFTFEPIKWYLGCLATFLGDT